MLRRTITLGSLLASLWAAMAAGATVGQEDYVVRVWGTEQGLPLDAVRGLAQTPDGCLGVGTCGGLGRFDESQFAVLEVANTPELSVNLINALFCDRQGRLWIGHDTGQVTVMQGRKFRRIELPAEWRRIPIRSFGEDSNGDIWALNALWSLAIINPAGEVRLAPEVDATDLPLHFDSSAPDGSLRVVTQQGRCYVARDRGLTADLDGPPAPSDGRRVIHSAGEGYWAVRQHRLSRWVGGKEVENAWEVHWGETIFAITCEWNGQIAAGTFRDGLSL